PARPRHQQAQANARLHTSRRSRHHASERHRVRAEAGRARAATGIGVRVLVTGITGFVGSHFAELALAEGAEVFGSYRWRSKTENIDHLRDSVTLIECDLRDLSSVHELVAASRPDFIIHLAAQSYVHASWHSPAETFNTNTLSQVNLLEAVRARCKPAPRFLAIGTSEEYGLVYENELPIKESNPLRPLSPYAVSKVTQDLMAYQYFKSYALPIVRA